MHMESAESTLLAAAKAAEREKVLWPYYCRNRKVSVTREDCLNNRLEALLAQKGHCATCQIGQALAMKKHGQAPAMPTPASRAEMPQDYLPKQGHAEPSKRPPAAKPGRVADKSTSTPKPVIEPEPEWMPTAEELGAAGIGPETEAGEGDPFATLEFEAAPEKRTAIISDHPEITIRAAGEIYLNPAAIERFGDASHALVRYAKTAQVVGIQPLTSRTPGAVKLRREGKSGQSGRLISAVAALKKWQITPAKSITLPVEWSEAHDMWCARLPAEGK